MNPGTKVTVTLKGQAYHGKVVASTKHTVTVQIDKGDGKGAVAIEFHPSVVKERTNGKQ